MYKTITRKIQSIKLPTYKFKNIEDIPLKKKLSLDYTPDISISIVLLLKHILTMFIANISPAIVIVVGAGFGDIYNSEGYYAKIYFIQMCILFAGVSTLFQSVSFSFVGSRLPIAQSSSYLFLPIILIVVADQGLDAMAKVTGGILIASIITFITTPFIYKIKFSYRPLLTGISYIMIGLTLLQITIEYTMYDLKNSISSTNNSQELYDAILISPSLYTFISVIGITFTFRFLTTGILKEAALLFGVLAGYGVEYYLGVIQLVDISQFPTIAVPLPLPFGIEVDWVIVISFTLISFICNLVGLRDVNTLTHKAMDRTPKKQEFLGYNFGCSLANTITQLFGGLPTMANMSSSRIIINTQMLSLKVITYLGLVFIFLGFAPKVVVILSTMPIHVVSAVFIMRFFTNFNNAFIILKEADWTHRDKLIFISSITVGIAMLVYPYINYYEHSMLVWDHTEHNHSHLIYKNFSSPFEIIFVNGITSSIITALILNNTLPKEEEIEKKKKSNKKKYAVNYAVKKAKSNKENNSKKTTQTKKVKLNA